MPILAGSHIGELSVRANKSRNVDLGLRTSCLSRSSELRTRRCLQGDPWPTCESCTKIPQPFEIPLQTCATYLLVPHLRDVDTSKRYRSSILLHAQKVSHQSSQSWHLLIHMPKMLPVEEVIPPVVITEMNSSVSSAGNEMADFLPCIDYHEMLKRFETEYRKESLLFVSSRRHSTWETSESKSIPFSKWYQAALVQKKSKWVLKRSWKLNFLQKNKTRLFFSLLPIPSDTIRQQLYSFLLCSGFIQARTRSPRTYSFLYWITLFKALKWDGCYGKDYSGLYARDEQWSMFEGVPYHLENAVKSSA